MITTLAKSDIQKLPFKILRGKYVVPRYKGGILPRTLFAYYQSLQREKLSRPKMLKQFEALDETEKESLQTQYKQKLRNKIYIERLVYEKSEEQEAVNKVNYLFKSSQGDKQQRYQRNRAKYILMKCQIPRFTCFARSELKKKLGIKRNFNELNYKELELLDKTIIESKSQSEQRWIELSKQYKIPKDKMKYIVQYMLLIRKGQTLLQGL